ncbi:MAG: hypothetical protein RLZZ435_3237 [Cyanobacteriota bacterium]|jgi:hypothetical protein
MVNLVLKSGSAQGHLDEWWRTAPLPATIPILLWVP